MELERNAENWDFSQLKNFSDRLDKYAVDYRVLGSLGAKSYIANGENLLLGPRKVLDVDVLVSRKDYIKLKNRLIREDINNIDGIKYDLSISKYIDFRPTEPYSYLIFKGIQKPVKSDLFEIRENLLEGCNIKTVPAISLFHTFSVCGGILRPKDWNKVLLLGRYIKQYPDNKFKEVDYADFHSFLETRKRTYPKEIWFLGQSQILFSKLPGFLDILVWKLKKRIIKDYLGDSEDWMMSDL